MSRFPNFTNRFTQPRMLSNFVVIWGEHILEYRKDIQVLRGVSVLLVVLYHLNVYGFSSGFLGVDIFFVISGFLMAILYDQKDVIGFFKRRARRLLPAYLVTIAMTMLVAFGITLKVEFDQVIRQAVFGVFFLSNIDFWSLNSYFSTAEFKPLLHLWSLAVEIQFYLFLPLLAWVFSKLKYATFLVCLVSIIGCFSMLLLSPKTAFFMLPFRVWEFLFGYIVAIYFTQNGRIKFQNFKWLGGCCLIFILFIPLFEIQGDKLSILLGHPGSYALLVSFSTATLLATGLPLFFLKSAFSNALEFVGKYSYSLYLVHFPIIVLYLYEPFLGTRMTADTAIDTSILGILIVLGTLLMFHLVEDRIRRKDAVIKKVFVGVVLTLFLSFMLGSFQDSKYTNQEIKIFNAWSDRDGYRCGLLSRILNPLSKSCLITRSSSQPSKSILLVGNSHADSIKKVFAETAEAMNIAVYFIVPNNPLLPSGMNVDNILDIASKRKVDAIVLHFSSGLLEPNVVEDIARGAQDKEIAISFVMPVPVWEKHVPKALLNEEVVSEQTIRSYEKKHAALKQQLQSIAVKGFNNYGVADILCNPVCRIVNEDGQLLYFDKNHLTLTGSYLLRPVFLSLLEDVARKN